MNCLYPKNPIYTKTKDQSPTKYGSDASVQNSFISDGCVIEGTVINSVLSRGVKVAKGAVIKNSIIMQDSVIEEDVELSHVVFDKEVDITKGMKTYRTRELSSCNIKRNEDLIIKI